MVWRLLRDNSLNFLLTLAPEITVRSLNMAIPRTPFVKKEVEQAAE
jgi:hypothetical protein